MPPKGKSRKHPNRQGSGGKPPHTADPAAEEANPRPSPPPLPPPSSNKAEKQQEPAQRKDNRRRGRRGGGGGREAQTEANGNPKGKEKVEGHVKADAARPATTVTAVSSPREAHAGGRSGKARLPAQVKNYVMTLRQLCDHTRADAERVIEAVTALLEPKGDGEQEGKKSERGGGGDPPEVRCAYTASERRPPSPFPSERGQTNATRAVSTHLLLLAVTRLSLVLCALARRPRYGAVAGDPSADRKTVDIATLRELTLLCRFIAWYCLETAPSQDGPTTGATGRWGGRGSRGASGWTTLGTPSFHRPGGTHSAGASQRSVPLLPSPSRSISGSFRTDSNDLGDIQGWLGSRMASRPDVAVTLPDTQLSEQLMRPVIEAVSRLAVYGIDRSDEVAQESRHEGGGRGGHSDDGGAKEGPKCSSTGEQAHLHTGATNDEETIVKMELRASTLAALCATLTRFPDSDFNSAAFLPLLFPSEDARAGPHVRHPLLTPLLWDPSPTSRSMAMLALNALLYKLQSSLQFAEEPKHKHQSFISLAAQGGAALSAIHDTVYWAIKQGNDGVIVTTARSAPKEEGLDFKTRQFGPPTQHSLPHTDTDVTLWFNVFSALSVVTPYHRCPHSLQVMLDMLDSPILRKHLHDKGGLPFAAATGFLANVFKNESLRGRVSERLCDIRTPTPLDESPGKATHEKSVYVGSQHGGALIADLLANATERVEVWRCFVHIARFYPKLIQQHFEPLLQSSRDAIDALLQQEPEAVPIRSASEMALTPKDNPSAKGQTAAAVEVSTMRKVPSLHHDPRAFWDGGGLGRFPARGTSSMASTHSASPDAFVECLRAWTHFMGYTWKAFDDNPGDPALKTENIEGRATLPQKTAILNQIVMSAMRLEANEEVRVVTLRCLAQIGDNCLSSAEVSPEQREQLVHYVLAAAQCWSSLVRAESLMTLGVWLWQYPVLDSYGPVFLSTALSVLTDDSDAIVRTKAAFAISNLTSRLSEPGNLIRESVEHVDQLFLAIMRAVTDVNPTVQGHGIRMINNLLKVVTFEELIADLPDLRGGVEECVAEGFLRTLLYFLTHSSHEAKHRWNAAYALGTGIARTVLFEAEPGYTSDAIEALMTVVVRDSVFKVRTQAANALAKIAPECLQGEFCPPELIPRIARALCVALVSAKTTESFLQFREQSVLQSALRSALSVIIETAATSLELDKVFVEYRQILVGEGLI